MKESDIFWPVIIMVVGVFLFLLGMFQIFFIPEGRAEEPAIIALLGFFVFLGGLIKITKPWIGRWLHKEEATYMIRRSWLIFGFSVLLLIAGIILIAASGYWSILGIVLAAAGIVALFESGGRLFWHRDKLIL